MKLSDTISKGDLKFLGQLLVILTIIILVARECVNPTKYCHKATIDGKEVTICEPQPPANWLF